MVTRPVAVVVGAGIGGLAAAVGLRTAGWDVTVLERSSEVRGVGAGISLWSNGLRALQVLGVGDEIRAHGTIQGEGGLRTPAGRWLSRTSGEQVRDDVDLSVLIVHRAELHRVLLAALPPGVVVTGATVTDVTQDGSSASVTHATEAGSRRIEAALVVGADGIHSRVRRALHPDAPAPRYAGFTAWRGVTDGPYRLQRQSETWGRGAVFGLTRLVDGRVYWFATGNAPEGGTTRDERGEVLRRFGAWHDPIAEVLRRTPADTVLRHDIRLHPRPFGPLASGRVALLGDAAHAMTPNLGQGGCLALEDAVVLASELSTDRPLPAALARYDALRRPRTERIARLSEQMGRVAQAGNPVAAALRSALVAATPTRLGAASLARAVAWEAPVIGALASGPG